MHWKESLPVKQKLAETFDVDPGRIKAKVVNVEHHRAHLAASFFASDFDRAFLLSMDALGDFASTMWGWGEGNKINILGEIPFPHSLGFYYTALTQYLGFLQFGDEYKVMGLSAYGRPAFAEEFKNILKVRDNKPELNLKYFLHHRRYIDMDFKAGYPNIDSIFSPYLEKRLGERRSPDSPLEKRHQDIAFGLQKRLEEVIINFLKSASGNGTANLCLAGGVAFNSAANGKLTGHTSFDNIYVPPAPGDAGLAIGAALFLWNQTLNKPREFVLSDAYWGPECSQATIKAEIKSFGLADGGYNIEEVNKEGVLCKKAALEISAGKIVGWFQGRMEFGPRALGNRSILADPRKRDIINILSNRIKHRESFRPFAPSVLAEEAGEYFAENHPSPFMSFVYKIKEEKRGKIPAVCHHDGTGRLQTVTQEANPRYCRLLNEFKKIAGVPVLLNTSFNENEPIVLSPREAIECFLRTDMDALVLGNHLIQKEI